MILRRPFIITLFLIVATTLICWNIIVRNQNFTSETQKKFINKTTLREFAAIDSRKPMYKQETDQLLVATANFDGDFRTQLQDWISKRRFDSEIMMDLIRLVKHPIDRYNNNMIDSSYDNNKRYNSCAVVGNSGILLNSDYGELIDSHEVVIRLNNAKTEQKVGKKTNISFTFSTKVHDCAKIEACFCHPYGENVPIIMYICKPIHFFDYISCNSSHKAPLMITDSRFDVLCDRIAKYYSAKRFLETTASGKRLDEWETTHEGVMFHYSSGMQAVMLAVGICDRVSLFGFGKIASAKHHYHDDSPVEAKIHDYEAEYQLYDDLVEKPQAIPFIPDKFQFPIVVVHR